MYILSYTANTSCVLCFPNCNTCVDGPKCTLCNSGYFLDFFTCIFIIYKANTSCVLCISNCNTCINGPKCSLCNSGYFLDFSTCIFIIYKVNTSCVACGLSNCITCSDGPVCSQCTTNYILDSATSFKTCIACPYKQYSYMNNCLPCISHCNACFSLGSNVVCT